MNLYVISTFITNTVSCSHCCSSTSYNSAANICCLIQTLKLFVFIRVTGTKFALVGLSYPDLEPHSMNYICTWKPARPVRGRPVRKASLSLKYNDSPDNPEIRATTTTSCLLLVRTISQLHGSKEKMDHTTNKVSCYPQ